MLPSMLYYLFALVAWLVPYALYWNFMTWGDYDTMASWAQVAVWWHQVGDTSNAWNPFFCGGSPLFGNSQLPLYHPSVPLYFLFGPVAGLKVMVLLWMSAGFVLFAQLWRDYGFGRPTALLFACAWALNGYFVGHLGQMHAYFTSFFLVPGFFLCIRRWLSTGRLRHLIGFYLLTLVAGIHSYGFFVYFYLCVPIFFALELVFRRTPWKKALGLSAHFGSTLILSLGTLAFFLLPALDHIRDFPRTTPLVFENPLRLITFLFVPGTLFVSEYRPWEYQMFIGPVLFLFFAIGCMRITRVPKDYWPLLLCGALQFLLSIGSFRALGWPFLSPFDALHQYTPVFSNVRVTSRFLIGFVPAALLLATWAMKSWALTKTRVFFIIAPLAGFCVFNALKMASLSADPAKVKTHSISNQFDWKDTRSRQRFASLESSVGILNCDDPAPSLSLPGVVREGPLFPDFPADWTVQRLSWNRIRLLNPSVRGRAEVVQLNMNHHRNWRIHSISGESSQILSRPGQALKVGLPAGAFESELVFTDPNQPRDRAVSWISVLLFMFLNVGVLAVHAVFRRGRLE